MQCGSDNQHRYTSIVWVIISGVYVDPDRLTVGKGETSGSPIVYLGDRVALNSSQCLMGESLTL